ncbi:uncharacterized protein LOC129260652 [Lytechinus pictus]|uniref:uncharacterized protein LOC129260652 n=1 Tax=Lytechinus pictus TaxID=7653 RepID=UPI00240D1364|nr:uncharacterized protein LOC129260652 [Lytechinus pictus]
MAPSNKVEDVDENLAKLQEKYGFVRPERGIDSYPEGTGWREGKPDYRLADLTFFQGKTKNHLVGSLEYIVENLVKKWEMEMTHLGDKKDWMTIDPREYNVSMNGGKDKNGFTAAVKGTYNWLLADVSKELYNASEHTFETSHKIFRGAFEKGFPWEVLEVFSGPPRVAFTWRHWGNFTGTYEERKGSGEVIELYGFTIATVNEELKIQKLEVYFKTDGFLEALQGKRDPNELARGKEMIGSCCPFIKSNSEN